ncbi:hypothetical protein HYH03_017033 [Edaphochlamys debaryana]|uniref:P/Homo B domain-containing protein n=1 Tax=Edaphochlamys debaryana TaxID=47281 RepID=A0A836BPP5_9CHLO|nr:hypothetical protein HYH03_017033 [Edaphochlamys debaryana]|eukprot:KAG2484152.1 hypothetical protein HYH03_017033 [Edaphochlamys debaryana]
MRGVAAGKQLLPASRGPWTAFGARLLAVLALATLTSAQDGSGEGAQTAALLCENSSGALTCPAGTVIATQSALYGRRVGATDCGGASISTECRASGTAAFMIANCNGRPSCFVNATNDFFGPDPCFGISKYFSASYSCTDPCVPRYAGPDAPVPDNDTTTGVTLATSSDGASCSGEVSALQVSVNLTHTCLGDLSIMLSSGSVTVYLARLIRTGGNYWCNSVNGVYTFADDPTLTNMALLIPRSVNDSLTGKLLPPGAYAPAQSLLPFTGLDPAGPWVLRVLDNAAGDVGIVHSYEVFVRGDTSPVLDEAGCGVLQEHFGIVPGSGWGSAPARQQKLWADSGCEPEKICRYWQRRYQVVPYESLGSMPSDLGGAWSNGLNCSRFYPQPDPCDCMPAWTWSGKTYTNCTEDDSPGEPWCITRPSCTQYDGISAGSSPPNLPWKYCFANHTVVCTFAYNGDDAPIPDNGDQFGITLDAKSEAPCNVGSLTAIRVAVNLTHTCVGDLTIELTSGSVTVALWAVSAGSYYCNSMDGLYTFSDNSSLTDMASSSALFPAGPPFNTFTTRATATAAFATFAATAIQQRFSV